MTAATRPRSALHTLATHGGSIAHWALVLAALGYLAWQSPDLVRAAVAARDPLADLSWTWTGVCALLAVAALALYGELHRRLLVVADASVGVGQMQAITFAENAISNTVPVVGGAGSMAYSIARLRRRGVDATLASWSVVLPGALSTIVLIVVAMVVAGIAGWLPPWSAVVLAMVVALGSAGLWAVLTRPAVLRRALTGLLHVGRRLPWLCRHCRGVWALDPDAVSDRLAARIGLLRPTAPQWLVLICLATVSWGLDYLALAAAAAAVGIPVLWVPLALGFLAVQASIALQILPGGAGLAEVGLLGALVAAGVGAGPAAATVLVYRLITWLGLSVIGWVVYAVQIHAGPRHRHRHAAELAAHPA
ncbi:lysylphosphatidylglycerol synthase transmembrane domain-containing protein [Pseudonocardia sp. N23]|uniref:lysylphosphatidylglycerol synthase transmembrane domain-containing protein n=1 Tax=Pseudonocardia sp. N23 TaxID=1987376 RepID=UPI0011453F13|nr:lysylphosphatidylglycerol synthase transmembrane domain-containing protein [Pseudonocardia sp. N23]